MSTLVAPDFSTLWGLATRWFEYLRPEMNSYELWRGVCDRVVIPEWAITGFQRSPVRRLLVLAADWCGDAANTVPVLAGLAAGIAGMELRVLDRDRFPEVMDQYLTEGARSIPIAIALDHGYRERGRWGPRPTVLQAWMLANKATIPTPKRYAYATRWYAKDGGASMLRELLAAVTGDR